MTTVRTVTWQAVCTLRFRLVHGEAREEVVLRLPRLSPLCIAWRRLLKEYKVDDVALLYAWADGPEADNIPAHYPCGLIADICESRGISNPCIYVSSDASRTVTPQQAYDEARAALWNSLKQGEHLRRGGNRRLQDLPAAESIALADALVDLDFIACMTVGRRIYALDSIRHVPVRFYIVPPERHLAPAVVQALVPLKIDGSATTVLTGLHASIPKLAELPHEVEVRSHGVIVNQLLGLLELLPEMSYVDGWLYLAVGLPQPFQPKPAHAVGAEVRPRISGAYPVAAAAV